jgi:hypothetical protein
MTGHVGKDERRFTLAGGTVNASGRPEGFVVILTFNHSLFSSPITKWILFILFGYEESVEVRVGSVEGADKRQSAFGVPQCGR